MSNFSERMGIKKPKTIVQLGAMDDPLRNGLWNAMGRKLFYVRGFDEDDFSEALWWYFFKKPIDSRPIGYGALGDPYYSHVWDEIKEFYFHCEWNEVYDFVEFVLKCYPNADELREYINFALETESSGYRVIDGSFVPISDEIEVDEVESALEGNFNSVSQHLKSSIDHLTDRVNPNYRNSIKESISAVEAMAKSVTGESKATLDDALKVLERRGALHPALKGAFSKLYGYTSDADGIRHALVNESSLSQADAKYFLVVCSAFINLLKVQVK